MDSMDARNPVLGTSNLKKGIFNMKNARKYCLKPFLDV